MRSITACAARWARYRRRNMKLTRIEIEADANELRASNTLAESLANLLRRTLAPVPEADDSEDAEEAEE